MYEQDFKYFKEYYDKSMQEMFAAVSDLYAEYWHDFFHFALFEDEKESWEAAFAKTHKQYMKDVKIVQARKVLDLACGRGPLTNVLAQNTRGDVLGIDISASQLSHTSRFKRKNLRFKQHDIMKIDKLHESFDAVIYLDAACYLPDKAEAISNISKIMNKGARLLLVDWCKQEGLNNLQEELVLHPFMKYWAIPNLETQRSYIGYFKKNNLKIVKAIDLNSKVRRNWDFGYWSAINGVKQISYADLPKMLWKRMKLGAKGIQLIKEQFPSALYIKAAFDAGFLRYSYFLVEK
ncbi:class I SAM-dependent methyltransferase [Candidatus Woesearchaeota archaeon]|nr:class I SAM-dependent methyltransferase [Candidatus Woesearchaeota archaeon]